MSGTAALAVGNLLGAVLGFALSALIGRGVGEAGLGAYATAAAWVFTLGLVVDAGVSARLTRDIAATPQRARALLEAAMRARLALGLLCAVGAWVFAPVLTGSPAATDALRVGVPLLLLNPLVAAYTAVFRAFGHLRRTAALNVAMLAAQTALTVVALGLGWGVAGAMLANVASSGAQALAAHRLYRRDRLPTSPETVAAWGLVRACWPFALAAVLAALQMRMGTVLSEAWAGAATAGLYAAAYRFIEAGRLIPQAAFDALLPALSASREHPERFAGLARRVGVRVAGYGVLFAIGCAVLGGRGQERRVTTLNALALAAQAAYSAALIPAYGLSGAGAALLLGELTGAVLPARCCYCAVIRYGFIVRYRKYFMIETSQYF